MIIACITVLVTIFYCAFLLLKRAEKISDDKQYKSDYLDFRPKNQVNSALHKAYDALERVESEDPILTSDCHRKITDAMYDIDVLMCRR